MYSLYANWPCTVPQGLVPEVELNLPETQLLPFVEGGSESGADGKKIPQAIQRVCASASFGKWDNKVACISAFLMGRTEGDMAAPGQCCTEQMLSTRLHHYTSLLLIRTQSEGRSTCYVCMNADSKGLGNLYLFLILVIMKVGLSGVRGINTPRLAV